MVMTICELRCSGDQQVAFCVSAGSSLDNDDVMCSELENKLNVHLISEVMLKGGPVLPSRRRAH